MINSLLGKFPAGCFYDAIILNVFWTVYVILLVLEVYLDNSCKFLIMDVSSFYLFAQEAGKEP